MSSPRLPHGRQEGLDLLSHSSTLMASSPMPLLTGSALLYCQGRISLLSASASGGQCRICTALSSLSSSESQSRSWPLAIVQTQTSGPGWQKGIPFSPFLSHMVWQGAVAMSQPRVRVPELLVSPALFPSHRAW